MIPEIIENGMERPPFRAPAATLLLTLLLAGAVDAGAAESADPLLEEVVVTATRLPTELVDLPFAAGVITGEQVQRARQQLGLDEALAREPGLFFQNRYNFAQDLRIAIRGFGARADFGIRGIRIFADDIPQTLPDGQGSVDAIDLGSVAAVEVLRGPFSAVYGSASGGVIHIRTEDGPERTTLSGRYNAGSWGFGQWQAKAGGQAGRLNWLANLSSTRLDGYRDHANYASDLVNSKFRYDFDDAGSLTVLLNAVDSPYADDPGGLTAAEAAADPRQAAPRNLLFDAGEALDQQTLGLAYRRDLGEGRDLLLRGYWQRRDFENRLPFDVNSNGQGGAVELGRRFAGLGAQFGWEAEAFGAAHRLVAGFDYDAQRDHRRRYANLQGVRGQLTTDQDEDVTTRAVFLQDALQLSETVALTLGGRYDEVEYEVRDRSGASGSGERRFSEFSPMAGLSWAPGDTLRVYGNLSTSFDPPATTELANPYAPTGFNPDLESQTATNYELGLKGLLAGRARYELALFHIDVQDALVPYELAGSGQVFFRNAGSATHQGLEASVLQELLPGLEGSLSYTWSDFSFDRFSDPGGGVYDGNRIPGIPEHLLQAALQWEHASGLYAGLDLLYAGAFYADNANSVETDAYWVADLRAGYRLESGDWVLEPFAGVGNLFDEAYMGNVRINAAFGRYYEPAPERNYYAGVSLSYGFP